MPRTTVDFTGFEIIESITEEVRVHHLKHPDNIYHNVKFVNTNDMLAVSGDHGKWLFCREFWPDPETGVSDGYWIEKLEQDGRVFDPEATREELEKRKAQYIEDYKEEHDKEPDSWDKYIRYYDEGISKSHESAPHFYSAHAYDLYGLDDICSEDVVMEMKTHEWLAVVFDAFDYICRQMKENPDNYATKK